MIELKKVIRDFEITNLDMPAFRNTKTGRIIDYSKDNLDWVQSQIDYFNSGFSDSSAWERFTTIIYKWYYNFGFKKFKLPGKLAEERIEKIHEWAEEAFMRFIKTYNNRIAIIKYFQGKADAPDDKFTKRILKKNTLDTEDKQFAYLFQSRIGSLSMYVISLKITEEKPVKEISLDYLMEKTQKVFNYQTEDKAIIRVHTASLTGYI